ncbi:hypothetical protein Ancab_024249 [Ancistrocladus abbreviatus]
MRTASMCFSILQAPRCRIYSLANIWCESFNRGGICTVGYTSKLLGSSVCGLGRGHGKRWSRKPISSKADWSRIKESTLSSTSKISHGISGEISSTQLNTNKTDSDAFQRIQYFNPHGQIAENTDLTSLVTFFVIDIETTGFSREEGRIIEIAIRDLRGGQNSTFQTLINPECQVPNAHVHGITNKMVTRPGVPRMEELIPILLGYIRSRQKPGGCSVFAAHNGRSFDIPFMINEFSRCSYEIPPDWLFLDTLPLAREAMKSGGSMVSPRVSLQALCKHYGIPLIGSAHRALSDVHALALVLQRITFQLQLPTQSLIERCFKASDVISSKKKKNS